MEGLFSTELSTCADIKSATDCLLRIGLEVMQAPLGNVQIIDWKKGYLEIISQIGFHEDFLSCFSRVTIREPSACGRVLLRRKQVVIDDVLTDSEYAPFKDVAARADYRSVQSTPLLSSSGAFIGVVSTHWPTPRRPLPDQLHMLRIMARLTANAIVRLRVRAKARYNRSAEW
jgi:GAF domain-containing protein